MNFQLACLVTLLVSLTALTCLASNVPRSKPFGTTLHFEENVGQSARDVRIITRGPGFAMGFKTGEVLLALARSGNNDCEPRSDLVSVLLVGAAPQPELRTESPLPGRINHFIGTDPAHWRTNIATFAQVRYRQVYPGIDLVYHGGQGELEYDFVVAPGAEPESIQMEFSGCQRVELDTGGDLVLHISGGDLRQRRPVLYQEEGGKRTFVDGSFLLHQDRTVGFHVGTYDRSRPLVIDPILIYSTYFGSSAPEEPAGISVDASGNVYVAGTTQTLSDFPFQNAYQTDKAAQFYFKEPNQEAGLYVNQRAENAFVLKLAPNGSLVYATYLGGSGADSAQGLAIDVAGNAYVCGATASVPGKNHPYGFPVTPGAYRATFSGGQGAFVAKFSGTGTLSYSTFLAAEQLDQFNGSSGFATAIAVDNAGQVYVTGTFATLEFGGITAMFVAKLNATGTGQSYFKAIPEALPRAIAVDAEGAAYITGRTQTSRLTTVFPTTTTALHPVSPLDNNAIFFCKLKADGTDLLYSTLIAPKIGGFGQAVAVDRFGHAYVAGDIGEQTQNDRSPGAFQLKNPLQPRFGGGFRDGFLAKFDPTKAGTNSLIFSTYLGGSKDDRIFGIDLDELNRIYVTGSTDSPNFPLASALQTNLAGGSDVFVAQLNAAGSALLFSSYFGGIGNDIGRGIAVGLAATDLYLTGSTESSNFPVKAAFQSNRKGTSDGFLTRIQLAEPEPTFTVNSENDIDDGFCDTGHCSLREAIIAANNTPGRQTILFTDSVRVIRPQSALPPVTDPVVIESALDGGFGTGRTIDGADAGAADGLTIRAGNCEVRGLSFAHFQLYGLVLVNGGGNTVEACNVGLGLLGDVARNGVGGILIQHSNGNVIGSVKPDLGCTIAGNQGHGIHIMDGSMKNKILGCSIGMPGGFLDKAIGNSMNGIFVDQSSDNEIGGPAPAPGQGAGNKILGNGEAGIQISGAVARNTVIRGNIIGSAFSKPGNKIGVLSESPFTLIGGTEVTHRNWISGNLESGVVVQGPDGFENRVQGNWIGISPDGRTAKPNGSDGVFLGLESSRNQIGGETAQPGLPPGNVISGNGLAGIRIEHSSGSTVAGNIIGPDVSGSAGFPSGFGSSGIAVKNSDTTTIGGSTPGLRNVVSGNQVGIAISGGNSPTRVMGNWIGTDISGTKRLANGLAGVALGEGSKGVANAYIGGAGPGEGNVIAFNDLAGIKSSVVGPGKEFYSANSIYENGARGISRKFPKGFAVELSEVRFVGGGIVVRGSTTNTEGRHVRIEFFASPACDRSGFGEGKTFLGATIVKTAAAGSSPFFAVLDQPLTPGATVLTATATIEGVGTTEFSRCQDVLTDVDTDHDGITDSLEDGAPNLGDGNRDGVKDRFQLNVGSVQTWQPEPYPTITLESPAGTVLKGVDAPLTLGIKAGLGADKLAPFGHLRYEVELMPTAPQSIGRSAVLPAPVEVKVFLPPSPAVNRYYLYGPEPSNPQPHWYDFTWNGTTGARFEPGLVRLAFIDGGRGDNDASANRRIVTVGALIFEGAVPFRFDAVALLPFDQVLLSGQVSAGTKLIFEKSATLGAWTPFTTNIVETGFFKVIDSTSPAGDAVFYRARSSP